MKATNIVSTGSSTRSMRKTNSTYVSPVLLLLTKYHWVITCSKSHPSPRQKLYCRGSGKNTTHCSCSSSHGGNWPHLLSFLTRSLSNAVSASVSLTTLRSGSGSCWRGLVCWKPVLLRRCAEFIKIPFTSSKQIMWIRWLFSTQKEKLYGKQ